MDAQIGPINQADQPRFFTKIHSSLVASHVATFFQAAILIFLWAMAR